MPKRPHKMCAHAGCGVAIPGNESYCDKHQGDKHTWPRTENRPNSAQRGYDSAWRRARKAYLAKHPLCECAECKRIGRVVPATVVDHRVPHRGDYALFWDSDNWQAMSKQCHDCKTARGE